MRTEIQVAGFGGQGIVLSGVILGEAAIIDGKNAVQTQSYGPESRGGAARSDVVISDEMVDYPKVLKASILVALSQPAFDKYVPGVAEDTVVVVDRDLVNSEESSHHRVSFTRIADGLGKKVVANTVMLGYIASLTGVISQTSLKRAILRNIPKATEVLNMKAFEEGWKRGSSEAGSTVSDSRN